MQVSNRKIDEVKTLYHGTAAFHEEIDLSFSDNPFKDFGSGYYLTTLWTQAAVWAANKGRKKKFCWVFEYELLPVPNEIQVRELLFYNLEWLDYVTGHRVHGICDEWDIVYDRMADSRFPDLTRIVTEYAKNHIPPEKALKRIQFGNAKRDQYCFKTQRAVSLLRRTHTYRMDLEGNWKELL